jgi:hypothetical protein
MFISKTLFDAWWHARIAEQQPGVKNPLRIGQQFFNDFNCHKVTSQPARRVLDKIHSLDGNDALIAIAQITDWEN